MRCPRSLSINNENGRHVIQVKANVGDIITVSVDHVTKKGDGSWGWYAPKVKEVGAIRKSLTRCQFFRKYPSCFHGSAGNGWEVVERYIQTQDTHHAKNMLSYKT
ncbi:MAG: hypothetical protein Q8O41_11965 [Candidatus Methanoperedens sp.]|nr:hypothetical protein [Candidatus Methanoperedens sp.]